MEKTNRAMDDALQAKVAELTAHNDETGDGRLDAADLKAQLNRIEAQLELQDKQNRRLLQGQRVRLILTCCVSILLLFAAVFLWVRTNAAYQEILQSCAQVNEIAGTLQNSLETLDPEELDAIMQDLPEITSQLRSIDVDALNDVLSRLPATMDSITSLQEQLKGIADRFSSGLGGLFSLS